MLRTLLQVLTIPIYSTSPKSSIWASLHALIDEISSRTWICDRCRFRPRLIIYQWQMQGASHVLYQDVLVHVLHYRKKQLHCFAIFSHNSAQMSICYNDGLAPDSRIHILSFLSMSRWISIGSGCWSEYEAGCTRRIIVRIAHSSPNAVFPAQAGDLRTS